MTLSATFYLRSSESRKFETIPSVKANALRSMLGHIPARNGMCLMRGQRHCLFRMVGNARALTTGLAMC